MHVMILLEMEQKKRQCHDERGVGTICLIFVQDLRNHGVFGNSRVKREFQKPIYTPGTL